MTKRVNSKGALASGIKQGLMVEGKSSRSEHWVWFTFYVLGSIGLGIANPYVGGVFLMIFFVPTISMHVRRIHDAGHSGFWLLLPPVAFVFMLKKPSTANTKWRLPNDAIVSITEVVEVLDDKEELVRNYQDFRFMKLDGTSYADANLNDFDFSGASLDQSDFSRTYQFFNRDEIYPVQFFGCDLNSAKFEGAELRSANFSCCNLINADFSGAELVGADFRGADLRNANFRDSDLSHADFLGANIEGATFSFAYIEKSLSLNIAAI
jgi:uncharacterized membrane protein YhaH (DUF805 family)